MSLWDRAVNAAWSLGVRARDWLKTRSLLPSAVERAVWQVGLRLFPAPGSPTVVALPLGGRLTVLAGSPSARTMAAGLYERSTVELLRRSVQPGERVADVGASVGYFSVQLSRLVGDRGSVVSFEPDPHSFALLERNLRENACANVKPLQLAAAAQAHSEVRLEFNGEWTHLSPDGARVAATSLDDALRGGAPLALVKIDVEGAELEVLRGMRETSQRSPTLRLVMEFNPEAVARTGHDWGDLVAELRSQGFTTYAVLEGPEPQRRSFATPLDVRSFNNLLIEK